MYFCLFNKLLSLNLKLVWGTRVSAKKILGKGVCLFNNETPNSTPLFIILLDMITLDDDLSLPDVLRAIHKHYSFSYAKINKEATALNQQAVSTPVNSKSKNSSTSKGNE